jgi:hypothetical protein
MLLNSGLPGDGAVAEWFKATVLKTVVPKGTGGSNPSCSGFGLKGYFLRYMQARFILCLNDGRTVVILEMLRRSSLTNEIFQKLCFENNCFPADGTNQLVFWKISHLPIQFLGVKIIKAAQQMSRNHCQINKRRSKQI